MIKISSAIEFNMPDSIEEHLCIAGISNWSIDKQNDSTPPQLVGYFDSSKEAESAYADLRAAFPSLSESFSTEEIFENDWKNEYKKYLQAWQCRNLHWVPVWERDNYKLPKGDKVFYFDAGLAFGTGDHPTTRLCAIRMLDYIESAKSPESKYLIDAGCGSGILAISAKLLGFGKVYAFDCDSEAIRVSMENEVFSGLKEGEVNFKQAGIEEALQGETCDILIANIQADILQLYSEELLSSVKSGGILVLSGILAAENDEVRKHFLRVGKGKIVDCQAAFMGEWSDLKFEIA